MARRRWTTTLVVLGLLAGTVGSAVAQTPIGGSNLPEGVIVRSDFVGPAAAVPSDGEPRGLTYALLPDGTDVNLWADSADNLDNGETALWYGDQVDVAAATAQLAQSNIIVCTVGADDPLWYPRYQTVEADGDHFCSGPWWRHKMDGKLQRRSWLWWRTADTDRHPWEYQSDTIGVSPTALCTNDGSTTWRNRSTGTVQGHSGQRATKSINSNTRTYRCGM